MGLTPAIDSEFVIQYIYRHGSAPPKWLHDAKIKEKVGENSPERGSHDDTFTYSLLIKPLINAVVNTKVLSQYINATLLRGIGQYRYLNLQFSGPSQSRGSKPQMSSFAYAELLLHLEIWKCVLSLKYQI